MYSTKLNCAFCISQCANFSLFLCLHRNSEKFKKVNTPKEIATKLGLSNYICDPTLTSKYGNDGSAWVVLAHAFCSTHKVSKHVMLQYSDML